MSNSTIEDIREHLPPYLSAEQKEGLFEEIKKFPNINYFTSLYPNDLLQGDGWSGFTILNFETGERKSIKGIILSNSCDIDINNERDTDVNITFVPLIKLDTYIQLLSSSGVPSDRIQSKIEAIKQQKATSIMYLPKNGDGGADFILNFDDIRIQPLQAFLSCSKEKLFTLSQPGFYVLLLKISIHFCRFKEGVFRS